jgi:DNA-binding beta-propeller fold protein YncE
MLKVNVRTATDAGDCDITGAEFLNDGRILVADVQNIKLKLFSATGQLVSELKLDRSPWDVTMLDTTTAAVTGAGDAHDIQLVSVGGTSLLRGQVLKTAFSPSGITQYRGQIAVTSSQGKNVTILNRNGQVCNTIHTDGGRRLFDMPSYIASNATGTMLFLGDEGTNEVISLSDNGWCNFRYRHRDVSKPEGVAVDPEGNVYVCGGVSGKITQLTSDGRLIRTLPCSDNAPWAISFRPGTGHFLLTHGRWGEVNTVNVMALE